MKHARPDYNRIQDPENKIPVDEPVFLLRARDPVAAATVRNWARRTSQIAGHDPRIVKLADEWANEMDKWPVKRNTDLPVIHEEEPETTPGV